MIKEKWYEDLIDDCKAIITESFYTSRWAIIEGYHRLGKRVLKENDNFERSKIYGKKICQRVGESLGMSRQTIQYAIQFARNYPDLDKVPERETISWHKICNGYLQKPEENIIDIKIPDGKYNLIVMDPPWPYGIEYNRKLGTGSPYSELTIEQIKNLQLPCFKDCVLWLWTTQRFIFEAKNIMDYWNFEYKHILVWDKINPGQGKWLKSQVEFCLLGIKGNPKWDLFNERNIIREVRREHSRKPESFYAMAEKLTKTKNKIDMFSREKRDGWNNWGNETDKF